jgi:hypothetical protein
LARYDVGSSLGPARRDGGRVVARRRENDAQIAVRVPADTQDRAERVRTAIQRKGLGVKVTTSEVYRQALLHGLKVLERRFRR